MKTTAKVKFHCVWLAMVLLAGVLWPPSVVKAAETDHLLMNKVIVVDAGHGGVDSGARGANGELEKHITLDVAYELAHRLRESGAIVYLTRSEDDDLAHKEDRLLGRRQNRDLRNRTRFAQSKRPDVFITVHCNAAPNPKWYGAQTFYQEGNEEGQHLAELMQTEFTQHLLLTTRVAESTKTLYLLRRIQGASVLAEVGFISNPREALHLSTPIYRKRVAFAIYISVLKYFDEVESSTEKANPTA